MIIYKRENLKFGFLELSVDKIYRNLLNVQLIGFVARPSENDKNIIFTALIKAKKLQFMATAWRSFFGGTSRFLKT